MNDRKPPKAAIPAAITPTVVLTTAGSPESYALATLVLPPYHPGIPPHQHPAHAEGCYVIHGTVAVTHGGRTITLTQGESILIAPWVAHTFWNPTAAPTTLLLIYQPGGEAHEISALAAGTAQPSLQEDTPALGHNCPLTLACFCSTIPDTPSARRESNE